MEETGNGARRAAVHFGMSLNTINAWAKNEARRRRESGEDTTPRKGRTTPHTTPHAAGAAKRSGGNAGKSEGKIAKATKAPPVNAPVDLSGAPEMAAHLLRSAWGLSGYLAQVGDVREERQRADVKRAQLRAQGVDEVEIGKRVPIPRYPDMMKIAAATRALRGVFTIAPDLSKFLVETGGKRPGEETVEDELAAAYGVTPDDLAPPLRVVK